MNSHPKIESAEVSVHWHRASVVVTDDEGKEYRITEQELNNILLGRRIVETRQSRMYPHITKIE